MFPGQSCGTGRTGEWKGLSRKSHASFTKFFEFSEKLQAKARRNLINASKLSTLRVWISRGFLGVLHRYPDVFFNLSSEGLRWSGCFVLIILLYQLYHIHMFLCHISHPTSRCKHTTSKSSPSWRSAHRKAEALSSGWSRHSFLRPGGSYFFQRCPEFCVQRVKNVTSQAIVAMVIFANAIWLAIQTDWRLRLGQEGAVVLACLVLLKWTCDKYSHSRSS